MIKITHNIPKLANSLAELNHNIERAHVSTLNKLAQQGLTTARKEIRKDYSVQLKDITRDSKGKPVTYTERTDISVKPAKIIGEGKGISLGKFKAKQKPTGVEVEVKRGNKKIITSAFGPKIPRLGRGVFVRATDKRLPIKKLYGPAAAILLGSKKISGAVFKFVQTNYDRILKNELRYFTKLIK